MKKIKICGLKRQEDIEIINCLKPDYCGFIINFPKSRRSISAETLKTLSENLSSEVIPVGVFVNQPAELVAELLSSGFISVAQLHGNEDNACIAKLKSLTDKPVWQAFQIHSQQDIKKAADSNADFILLDAGQGGGKAFNWQLLQGFERPFGLAGGININNIADALKTQAELIDVSGGVETNGFKDKEKIKQIINYIRN